MQLSAALPLATVEHIGSSSIPQAISKGDIDVLVAVAQADFAQALAALVALGYEEKNDTLRTPQLCMLVSPRADIDLAIQLIERGSKFEFFLTFRDALRADPDLVAQYNQIKRCANNSADYRLAKSSFIDEVLRRANKRASV